MFYRPIRSLFQRVFQSSRRDRRATKRGGRRTGYRLRLESLEDRLVLDAVSWSAAVDGNWSDASKWSPHAPGVGDTVTIDKTGANYTVTLDTSPTIAGFTLNSANATFFASGRTLTVNGTDTLSAGSVLWRNSNWAGSGTLTNNASMTFQGGSAAITSAFAQNGTALIQGSDAGGSGTLTVANGFSNAGTITLQSINQNWDSNLVVTTGTLTNTSTGTINSNQGSAGGRTLAANLANSGNVNINADTSFFRTGGGTYTNTNAVTIATGKTLVISGSGQVFSQDGGTLTSTGTVSVANSASFNFNGGTTSGNPILVTNAALNLGPSATETASFTTHGGSSTLSGNVAANTTILVQGADAGGSATLTAAASFSNAGTITLQSTNQNWDSNLVVAAGTLTNAATGIINSNQGTAGGRTISANLTNNGTININTDTSFSKSSGVYTNTNAIAVAAGKTLSINGSSQVFNQNDGTLSGTGTLSVANATFNFNGGTTTGSPVLLTNSALNGGAVATQSANFTVHGGSSTFSGIVNAATTIWVQGSNAVGSATLTAPAGFTNAGTIRLESIDQNWDSNLAVTTGTLTNTGVILVGAGTAGNRTIAAELNNQGTLTVNHPTTISKASAAHTSSGAININNVLLIVNQTGTNPSFTTTGGAVNVTGSGFLEVNNGAFNFNGGTISATLFNVALSGNGSTDTASFIVWGGSGTVSGSMAANTTIWVQGSNAGSHATLTAAAGFTNAGTIRLESIDQNWNSNLAGTVTNAPSGLILTGAGTGGGRTIAAELNNQGTLTVNHPTTISKASAAHTSSGTININNVVLLVSQSGAGASFTTTGGAVNVTGSGFLEVDNGAFNFNGGAISASLFNVALSNGDGVTDPATFIIWGGSGTTSGTVAANTTIWVQGSNAGGHALLTAPAGFTNAGTIRLESINQNWNSNLAVTTGTLTNAPSGVILVGAGTGGDRTIAAQLNNQGTVNINFGTNLSKASAAHVNSGTINVTGGDLTVNQSGTNPTFTNNGVLNISSGRTLSINGGSLTNFNTGTLTGGTYNVAGKLRFPGAAITTNAATIVLDGANSQIVDSSDNNALASFAVNAAAGSFTIQNGRNFTTTGNFTNQGTLAVGSGSAFTVDLSHILTSFSSGTLTEGTYQIAGTLRFANANIVTNAATVVLDGSASQIINQSSSNGLANFASNTGSFTIRNGRNLTTAGNFSNTGTLTVGGTSTFKVTGNLTTFSGTTLTAGTYVVAGTLQFTGANIVTNAATLVLDGSGSQIIDETGNDALTNFASNTGNFTIQNGRNLMTGPLSNTGTLSVGANSTLTVNGAYTQASTLTIQASGTVVLNGGGTLGGTISDAGTLTFAIGTFTLNGSSSVTGSGMVVFAGGTTTVAGTYNLSGATSVTGGTANFTSPVTSLGSSLTVSLGTANLSGGGAITVAAVTLSGGTLTGSDNLTVSTTMNWTGGTLSGTGSTLIGISGALTIAGAADKTLDGRTLNLAGTTTWTDTGNIVLANGATLNNQGSGGFTIQNDQTVSGSGTFRNAGTLNKASAANGTTTIAAGVAFSNNTGGTVNVQSGTLSVAGNYTQNGGDTVVSAGATLASGGLVNVLGGTLSGAGTVTGNVSNAGTLFGTLTINGNVTNSGQLNPGGSGVVGTITINGNYTQTASGVLNITIQDAMPGDFSQLIITGTATLQAGCTLNVNVIGTVNSGDQFVILTFASETGDFAAPPPGFNEVFGATSLTLVAQ
jgi:hypothetical protein